MSKARPGRCQRTLEQRYCNLHIPPDGSLRKRHVFQCSRGSSLPRSFSVHLTALHSLPLMMCVVAREFQHTVWPCTIPSCAKVLSASSSSCTVTALRWRSLAVREGQHLLHVCACVDIRLCHLLVHLVGYADNVSKV